MISASHSSPRRQRDSRASSGGGAFSPSVGRAAGQVTEDILDDLSGCTDRVATAMKRTSLVRNGCCPGGPEHWITHLVWCPAVKVCSAKQGHLRASETPNQTPLQYFHRSLLPLKPTSNQLILEAKQTTPSRGGSSPTKAGCGS